MPHKSARPPTRYNRPGALAWRCGLNTILPRASRGCQLVSAMRLPALSLRINDISPPEHAHVSTSTPSILPAARRWSVVVVVAGDG
jgi:hypothetical protein